MSFFKTVTITLIISGALWARPLLSQEQAAEVQPKAVPSALAENLKGLKKAELGELDRDKEIILNPDTMPMYSPEGKRLSGKEFMDTIMSGSFVPEPFIDDKKEVKAFVFRAATEEEKKRLLAMMKEEEAPASPQGKEAKPFSVADMKGNKYSLEKLKGKVTVINFWFLECRPCRAEIPELNKLVDQYRGKDVVFLGMSTNKTTQLEQFLSKTEFRYNIIPESGMIAATYGVTGFPTHIVIDRDSKVTYFASGFGPGTIETLKGEIERLLKK